jgi:hypothetical protein
MPNDATSQSGGRADIATGSFTGAGAEVDVELGFTPRYIKIMNMTDATTYEFCEGMADTQTMKTVTGGAMTVDTNSIIVPDAQGFVVAAGGAANGKDIVWVAMD